MKRDLDLVKRILEHFEEKSDWSGEKSVIIGGYEEKLIAYHIQIMYEGGLINAEPLLSENGRIHDAVPFRLTWQGHESLDNIKDESRWTKIKEIIKDKGGTFSFEVIVGLATKLAETNLLGC